MKKSITVGKGSYGNFFGLKFVIKGDEDVKISVVDWQLWKVYVGGTFYFIKQKEDAELPEFILNESKELNKYSILVINADVWKEE